MAEPIELNEIIKAYAEKKGITPTDAMLEFKKNFVHRSEVSDTALNSMKPYNTSLPLPDVSEDLTHAVTESSRVEMKKLEIESRRIDADMKRVDAEQRKQDLAEKKLEYEMAFQREKLDREEKLQQRKLDAEETWRQRQASIAEERSAMERLILLQSMTGKKPDELVEMMKSQSGMALEMVKAQASGTEKMYQTLLDQKNAERDREMEIKTALAKIEAERDIKLGELKQEADAETATQMQMLVDKMEEKFGTKITEKMPSSAEAFITQMTEYKKMQDQFLTLTFDTLEARGFDKDQIATMKKAAKIEEQKQDTTVDKVWEVGKKIWKDYVEPNIDKAQKELSPPQYNQGGQIQPPLYTGPTPEQIEQQKRVEADRLRQEMTAKQKEKELLEAQIKHERQIYEQRQQLENRAIELGIPISVDMTDRQISDLIIRQEFALEQVRTERLKLEARAMTLGIPFDDTLPSDQLFDIIEHREAEVEQQHLRGRHAASQHMGTIHVAENTKPREEQVISEAVVGTQAPIPKEQTEPATQTPQIDIHNELIKPPEVSKETEEFLKGMPASVPEADAPQEVPKEELQEAKKKGRKKKDKQGKPEQEKQEKQGVIYHVIREDGEPVGDIEAKNPHGAAMKAARIIGAEDASINIKISGGGLDKEQSYEVAMVSTERHDGKQIQVAKANRVQD